MFKLALRGVRFNIGRYIATLVAIITGVAFFTATGFVGDRVTNALEGDAARQYANVEVAVVVDDSGAGSDFADELRVGADVADAIRALPEVDAVGGDLTGSVAFLGADGDTFANSATGRLWIEDDELNPIELDDGVAPAGDGEIAVDKGIASNEGLEIGDQVTILTLSGPHDATIVGITSFGNADAQDQGGTVSISAANAFDWLNSGQLEFQALYVRGNVDEVSLQEAVEPLVPPGFVSQTGTDFINDKQNEVGGFGRTLKIGLQAFAILALFVGAFVIYNTFSVIVAQRLRELAVLAAVGATPKQLKRSLRFEGLVIGLVGSALGVVAGFGLAYLLVLLLDALGFALPGSGITVSPAVVVQGLFLGTLITFLSVMVPARRAAKTEPIEALRQSAVESAALTKGRVITSLVLIVLGAAGMLLGSTGGNIGLSALLLFIGVIVAGPLIAVVGAKVFRPLLHRFGLEGRLAADNTARNPQRTATTANALLIGVFLVTFVTVAGTSLKDFAVAEINSLSSADYVLISDGGTIDDQLIGDLEGVEGVEIVVPFRREVVSVTGGTEGGNGGGGIGSDAPSAVSTGDFAAMQEIAGIEVAEGSFDDLGPNQVLMTESAETDYPIGSTVTFTSSQGNAVDLEVVGTIKSTIDTSLTGNLVDEGTFDAFVGATAPTVAFMDVVSGAQTDTEDAIDGIIALRPDIQVIEGNAIGQLIGSVFDFLINAVNGLLLMSVVVALIGIVNTLSLSILERRRELGLLRVVGMVDKRVQRMVRIEAVLISALGTFTGMILGTFAALATLLSIDRLSDANISISVPWLWLIIVLVLGILLGFLAALIPAKRSTRLDVLDAIQAV